MSKKFRNTYDTEGDTTIITLGERDGVMYKTEIDTEELQRLIDFGYSWFPRMHPVNKMWYAIAMTCKGKSEVDGKYKYSAVTMQSFIGNPEHIKGVHVDHINHDGLCNKKKNLRVTNVSDNLRNRKSKNITNTSGYRNVSKSGRKWVVILRVDGKQKQLGSFYDVDEAGEFAEKMRAKYYGDYAGES